MVLWTAVEYFHLWMEEKGNNNKESVSYCSQPHILTCNIEHDAILLPLKHYQLKKLAGKIAILLIHNLFSVF